MSELKTVFRHSRVYSLASLLNNSIGFLLVPLYTRYLVPAEYGTLALVMATSEIIGTAVGLGLGMALSRIYFDFSDERERGEVVTTAVLGLAAITAASCLPLAFFAAPLADVLLGAADLGSLLVLGLAAILLNSLFTLGLHYLRIQQRSSAVLVATTLRSLGYLVLNPLFVAGMRMGVRGVLLGTLLTHLVGCLVLLGPILVRLGPRFSRTKLAAMLRFGAPVLPGSLAEFFMTFADRYLLVHLASLAATGVYFFGFRFGNLLYAGLMAPFAEIYAVRRIEAHGAGKDDPEAAPIFTYFFLVVATAGLGLAFAAPELVALLAPATYGEARHVIPLIALAQVVQAPLLITQLGIFYKKVSGRLSAVSFATVALHVSLNALLIARWGIVGAGAAAVVSTAFKLALTARLARGLGGPRPEWNRLFALLAAAVAVFAAGSGVQSMSSAWGLPVRAAMLIAFPLIALYSPLFAAQERAGLLGLIRRRRPAADGVVLEAPEQA